MKNGSNYLTLIFAFFISSVQSQTGFLADNNTIIVSFAPNTSYTTIETLRSTYKATVVDSLVNIPKTYRWQLKFPNTVAGVVLSTISATEGSIKGQSSISGGSGNYIVYTDSMTRQGYDANLNIAIPLLTAINGANKYDANTFLGTSCRSCWVNKEKEQAVKIAQFDSGFDPTAAAPSANSYLTPYIGRNPTGNIGYSFVGGSNPNASLDSNGHGTFVFGIMAQMAKNWGLNNLKIYPYKTQNKVGEGSVWNLCKAFDKAISERINIVNLSVNFKENWTNTPEKNALFYIIKYVGVNHNILVINSVANDAKDISVPNTMGSGSNAWTFRISPSSYRNCPNLIAVSAIDQQNKLANFSNLWFQNTNILAMPGVDIRSIYLGGVPVQNSGSSFSAPMLTANACLLAAMRPSSVFDYTHIRTSLQTTAVFNVNTLMPYKSQYIPNICSAISMYKDLVRATPCVPISGFNAPTTDNGNNQNFVAFKKNVSSSGISFELSPNPCTTSINLDIETDVEAMAQATIYNLSGQGFLNQKQIFSQGINRLSFDVSQLPNGIYNCVIILGDRTISQKFMKE
jgi:hypothetical protein